MTLSFIAFHMADYQRDTMQLSLEGHSTYFLLLQHCWTHGRIPADDASRAAICKVPVSRWRKQLAPLVSGYFDPNGENKRASIEIAKVEKMRLQRAMAGHNGGAEAARRKGTKNQAVATAAVKRSLQQPSSGREATLDKNITTTFVGTAREAAPVDNSAAESAAPAAGSAGKPVPVVAKTSSELKEIVQRKYR